MLLYAGEALKQEIEKSLSVERVDLIPRSEARYLIVARKQNA